MMTDLIVKIRDIGKSNILIFSGDCQLIRFAVKIPPTIMGYKSYLATFLPCPT
jgi:hypothetical protein